MRTAMKFLHTKIIMQLCSAAVVLLLISLSGCTTYESPRFEKLTEAVQDEKYNIQVRVVPSEELQHKSGRIPSPFVRDPGVFDQREYVVFELTMKNKTDKGIRFELTDLELKIGAGSYYAKNEFQIKQYWDQQDDIKSNEKGAMNRIMKTTLLPRTVNVPADGLKRGYVVFLAKVPKYGDMIMLLPIVGEGFKPDIYEFTYSFTRL